MSRNRKRLCQARFLPPISASPDRSHQTQGKKPQDQLPAIVSVIVGRGGGPLFRAYIPSRVYNPTGWKPVGGLLSWRPCSPKTHNQPGPPRPGTPRGMSQSTTRLRLRLLLKTEDVCRSLSRFRPFILLSSDFFLPISSFLAALTGLSALSSQNTSFKCHGSPSHCDRVELDGDLQRPGHGSMTRSGTV